MLLPVRPHRVQRLLLPAPAHAGGGGPLPPVGPEQHAGAGHEQRRVKRAPRFLLRGERPVHAHPAHRRCRLVLSEHVPQGEGGVGRRRRAPPVLDGQELAAERVQAPPVPGAVER
ncbi:MAG: hypothetical protein ACK55Z_11940, partial [bacterium]